MDAASIEKRIALEAAQRPAADEIEIDADDEGQAVSLFLALDTQWNWTTTGVVGGNGGFGMRTGIRYEAIAPVAAALELTVNRQVMVDLREMEATALKTLAEAAR